MSDAVSPGGPRTSAVKKRRLAALERTYAAQSQAATQAGGTPSNPPAVSASQRSQHPPANTPTPPSASAQGESPPASAPLRPNSRRAGERGLTTAGGARPLRTPGDRGGGVMDGRGRGGRCPPGGGQGRRGTWGAQGEAEHGIYARLDAELARGALAQALQLPEPGDGYQAVGQLLEDLIRTNPGRALDARSAIGLKVADRALLLENPAVAAGRSRVGKRRLSERLASKKEQRRLGLYAVEASGVTYDQVQPLHQRWRQYVGALLATATGVGAGGARSGSARQGAGGAPAAPAAAAAEVHALLGADLHGCLLEVCSSREERWRGVTGVVVRDTQQALVVVTPQSRVVTLPKRPCVFRYRLPGRGGGRVVELLGCNMVREGAGAGRGRRR